MAGSTDVLIVSDVRLYREGLVIFLNEDARLDKVESCADPDAALASIHDGAYGAVCVDCGMEWAPMLAQRLLKENVAVVLMGLGDDAFAAARWLPMGIGGCLCKDASVEDLICAIERAVEQQVFCSRTVSGAFNRRFAAMSAREACGPPAELTSRERQIGRLLELGWSNKRIAHHLNITVSTTKNHVHNILAKLSASSRSEAAAKLRSRRFRDDSLRQSGQMA